MLQAKHQVSDENEVREVEDMCALTDGNNHGINGSMVSECRSASTQGSNWL